MGVGLRERKKQQLRQAIVDAAIGLFRDRGFEQTTVQDILERAQISLGTFYNYFPGKDAVLDHYGASVIAAYAELASDQLDADDQPVAERVRALALASGKAFSTDPAFMTVIVTKARAFGGRGQLPPHDVPIYGLLTRLFTQGQTNGEIRSDVPPLELAETFSGVFMFTVVSWLTGWQQGRQTSTADEAELEGRLMRAFDVFLDGCRTNRRAPTHSRGRRRATD